MSHQVHCRKYGKTMDGLDYAPFPGPVGEQLWQSVSKQAWQEWLAHQTTLINEKRLNVMQAETKTYLAEQRELFLSNQNVEVADGFVAK